MILSSWLTTVSNRIRNASARRRMSRKFKGNRYARPAGVMGSSSTTYSRPAGDIRERLWHTFDVAPRFSRDSRRFARQAWNTSDVATMTERLEDRTLLTNIIDFADDTSVVTQSLVSSFQPVSGLAVTLTTDAGNPLRLAANLNVYNNSPGFGQLEAYVARNGSQLGPSQRFFIGPDTGSEEFGHIFFEDLINAPGGTGTYQVFVRESSGTGLVLDGANGTTQYLSVTEFNSIPEVNLSVSTASGIEAGTTSITVTATADPAVSGDQTVDLAVTGTGITAGDYTLTDGDAAAGIQIKILDGETTGSVTFTVVDDILVEGTETATLTIGNPSAGILLGSTVAQNVAITDNDTAGSVSGTAPTAAPDSMSDTIDVTINGGNVQVANGASISTFGDPTELISLTINGVTGEQDIVNIDFDANPGLLSVGTINVNLGGDNNDDINITVNGQTVMLDLTAPGAATLTIDGVTINATGIGNNTITVNGAPDDLTLTFGDAAADIDFHDIGGADDQSEVSGTGFTTTQFDNPSNSLTVILGSNGDAVTFTSLDAAFNPTNGLTVTGGAGNDTLLVTDLGGLANALSVDLGAGAADVLTFGTNPQSLASIVATAEAINVNVASLTTTGNQTYNGAVTLGTSTVLTGAQISLDAVALGANTLTIANSGASDISGVVAGSGGLTKNGAGTLTLSGTNTYTGTSDINAGVLEFQSTSGFHSYVGGDININNGSTLQFRNNGGNGYILDSADTINFDSNGGGLFNVVSGNFVVRGSTITTAGGAANTIQGSFNMDNGDVIFDVATGSDPVDLLVSAVLGNSQGIVKQGAGTIALTGANTYSGGTTLNSGKLTVANSEAVGTGTLTLAGGTLSHANGPNSVNLNEAIVVSATTAVFTESTGTSFSLSGDITGSGTLVIGGEGSGQGTQGIGISDNLDGFTGKIIWNNTADRNFFTLQTVNTTAALETNGTTGGEFLRLFGNATFGELSGTGGRILGDNRTLTINQSTDTTYAGQLADVNGPRTLGLTKDGSGTLTLTGANTYSRTTTVSGGTLKLGIGGRVGGGGITVNNGGNFSVANNAFNTVPGTITINAGGTVSTDSASSNAHNIGVLNLNGGTLTSSGAAYSEGNWIFNTDVTVAGSTLSTISGLQVGSKAGGGTFNVGDSVAGAGTDLLVSAPMVDFFGGSSFLTKTGSGTMELTGANTYTGATTVSNGTLALSGSFTNNISGSSTIDVQAGTILDVTGLTSSTLVLANGQTLKGNGTVSGTTSAASGSTVSPGTSPGILNTGNLNLSAGTFNVEIGGTSPGTANTNHDQLNVTGTVTLGPGSTLNETQFNSFTPMPGDEFVIINNNGADAVILGGTGNDEGFEGLKDNDLVSADFLGSGLSAFITYNGGDGNDVVLVVAELDPTFDVSNEGNVGGADNFTIDLDGSDLVVRDGGGNVIFSRPLVSIAGTLTITGEDGQDDNFTVDFDDADLGINIEVRGGTDGNDSLNLVDVPAAFTTHTYNYTNANDGNINFNSGARVITYTGLEPLTNDGDATNIVFNLPNTADNSITLDDLGGGMARLTTTLPAFEQTDFAYPLAGGALRINTGAAAQTITVQDLALNANTDLIIVGDANDTVTFSPTASVTITDGLSVTAGTITQTAEVIVAGTTTMTALAAGTITLTDADNDFQGVVNSVGGNVDLTDVDDIQLGTVATTTLDVIAGGAGTITQDATQVAVTGAASFTATDNDITLTDTGNNFGGAVTVTGANVALTDTNAIDLAASTVTGNLAVTAGGAVTDSGALAITGTTTITNAGNTVMLDGTGTGNAFTGAVSVTGSNVTLRASTALELNNITTTGTFAATAVAGALTDSTGATISVGTQATLIGSASITLGDQGGDTTNFGTLRFSSGGAVSISEDTSTVLSGAGSAASLTLVSVGTITNDATSNIAITNNANLSGTAITLGTIGGDSVNFGTLTFNSAGAVTIEENTSTDVAGTNTAGALTLTSAAGITDATGASIIVTSADLTGTSITLTDNGADMLTVTNNGLFTANGGGTITIAAPGAATFGTVTLTTTGTASVTEDDNMVFSGSSSVGVLNATSAGNITDGGGGDIAVAGLATFTGGAGGGDVITLGDNAGNDTTFGSLRFVLTNGTVSISEDDATNLAGASSAGSLDLNSAGAIVDNAGATLVVTGLADFADAGGAGITLDNAASNAYGTLTINSTGAVVVVENDATDFDGVSTALSLDLDSTGAINDSATADITVTNNADFTGTAITLGQDAGNDVNFGSLTTNTSGAGGSQVISEDSGLTAISLNAGAGNITLIVAGAVVDGDGANDITATSAAVTADGGIGSAQAIATTISTLAFSNTTGGNVQFSNTGALTIGNFGGVVTSSNVGTGTTTLTASSPVTFAVSTSSGGDLTANATEGGGATDDITVNGGGVTVQSTAGDVIFNAGDDILISGGATVQATAAGGDVTFNTGVADDDNLGVQTLDGTITANAASGVVTLNLNAEGSADQAGTGTITGQNLRLLSTGADGSFALATSPTNDVDVIAAATTGAINFRDDDGVTVGTVTTVGITTSDDAVTIESSQNAGGTITVSQAITTAGVGTTGSVELNGNVVVNASLTAAGGTITLNGQAAATSDLVINANITSAASIDWTVQRDIIVNATVQTNQAGSDITLTADSDNNGTGGVRVTTAGQVDSADEVTIQGSDLFVTGGGVLDSVDIQTDGTNNQIQAGGNIGIAGKAAASNDAQVLINGRVTTTGAAASVNIFSRDDILFGAAGDVLATASNAGITVTADQAGGGDGFITMTNGAVINAGSGLIDVDAAGNVTIASLTTTGEVRVNTTAGAIIDGGNTDVDIVATSAELVAVTGIGSGNALETTITTLAFSNTTSGTVQIDDSSSLTIGNVNGRTSSDNNAAITINATSGVLTVDHAVSTTAGTGGGISISGAVDINAPVTAGVGTITLNGNPDGAFDLEVDANLTADLAISLTAPRDILVGVNAAATIQTTGAASDITLTADSETTPDGVGGVQIAAAGQINSGRDVTLRGSDLFADAGGVESVQIDDDGAGVNQVLATRVITIQSGANAPAAADIEINGQLSVSGAAAVVTIDADQDALFGVNGDILTPNAAIGGLHIFADQATAGSTGGVITMADGTVFNTAAGTMELVADGNFTIGQIITTGLINAASLAGSIVDGGDTGGDDIQAASLAISGETGVGTDANAFETAIATLSGRANSGDFNISNTGNLDLNAVQLTAAIQAIFGESEVIGVSIEDSGAGGGVADSGADNITIVTTGSLTVSFGPDANGDNGGVQNNDGGNITLTSSGVAATNDLAINAPVDANGGTGTITFNAGDSITQNAIGDVTAAGSGAIDYNAGTGTATGLITMADGATTTSGSGLITMDADVDITLGGVVTAGEVRINSTTGAIIDGGNTDVDITAATAQLLAATGIGDAGDANGQLDTAADATTTNLTIAASTVTGDINVTNTGHLIVGTVNGTNGASVTTGGVGDDILLIASSPLTVNSPVTNAGGGNITLTATNDGGNDDDLTINANVTATGGNGAIDLNAGTDLFVQNNAVVSTVGAGAITGDAVRQMVITTANAAVQSADGNITLNANQGVAQAFSFDGLVIDGDAEVTTANGAIALNGRGGTTAGNDGIHIGNAAVSTGTVSVTGATGTITIVGTGNATNTAEGVVIENAGSVISSTGGAISITGTSTAGDDGVEITAADITATNAATITIIGTGGTGFGTGMGINIDGGGTSQITSDTGNVQMTGVGGNDDGISVNSAIVSSNTGTITLMGTGGNAANSDGVIVIGNSAQITSGNNIAITGVATNGDGVEIASGVASPIDATGAATISITGTGGTGEVAVQIDSPIDSATGTVTITALNGTSATDDITFGVDGDVTSASGVVTINADTASNTADVFMADGAVINAGSGQIDIDADVDVTLGSIQTTSVTEPSIEIDAIAGAVIDGGDTDTDIVIGAGGTLAIRAVTGVGSANAIDTDMTTTTIAVSNSTSGNVQIDNSTAAFATSLLTVETVDGTVGIVNSGAGTVALTNASAINIEDNITSGGNITITLNDNAGFIDDLFVEGQVSIGGTDLLISSTTGNILFNVGDDAVIDGDITVSGAAATVTFNMDPAAGDAEVGSNATDGATLTIASDPDDAPNDVSVITTNSANNAAAGTFINGGNQNDTFNFAPQATTDFVVNGNPPVFLAADVPPGDILNLDLVNVTRGNAILTIGDPNFGDDGSAGTFTFIQPAEDEQSVMYTSIETVSAIDSTDPQTDADYHLVVDLGIVGPRAAGASTLGYQDGTADIVDIRLNAAFSGDVEVRIDDGLGGGLNQVFAGQNGQILSLTVIGTNDDETVVLTETAAGLPSFSTLDEEPIGTSIALAAPAINNTANNGGVSAGSHLGTAFETHIDREPVQDANGDLDIAANHVTLHFDGGAGVNALRFDLLTDKDFSYFSDLADAGNSGNIGIVDDVSNQINLAISFANLSPIDINGAGGDLRIDATDTPATYQLTITDVGGADGDTQIVGDNGFETTNFSGFANVEIYGGTGSEIIDLVSVDGATPVNAGAEALVTLRLDGDNTGNAGQGAGSAQIGTDTAADRIHVRSLPGTVDLTIFGGAGDDQFEIFSADTAGDSANTVDLILGQIFISPTAGSGAAGEDSQDEGGTDSLTIVDRADTTGDTVRFTHSGSIGGGDGVATIDGLFDAGTGVDLTVNVNINELIFVGTDGADTLELNFGGIRHDLDNIEIYAAGGQDIFDFENGTDTPAGATILLDGDENTTDPVPPANTGINNDTIDFSAFTTARTVTLTGVGPTSVTLTAGTAFTVAVVPATTATLLNALDNNTVDYPAAGTDILVISGTDTDGNPFSTNFSVNSATTIQNLLDAINAEFDGAVVTLNGAGQLVVTANATGPVSLALSINDRVGNTGATTFPTMNVTDDGLGGSNETLQTATALTLEVGGGNAVGTTTLNALASNAAAVGGVNYDGAGGAGADTIVISGVDTTGNAVSATLANVNATTTVNDLLGAINGAFTGATATLANGIITLRANAEGTFPLALVINDGATSDGSTRWDNHIFVQTTLGTSTVVDGFTGTETSINGTFTNIDSLRGPDAAGDTLVAPDLNNHWDLFDTPLAADSARGNNLGGFVGTDHGNLVASRASADARLGGATTVGRPTALVLSVPIVATFPEQDLIFASFENLTGGSLSDHFDLRDAASVSEFVDGSGGNDSIDYRDYTTSVVVDLFTGTATNINGGAAGGLVAGAGGGTDDNSIENAIGGAGADFIAGDNDNNILGDGPGNDYLNGGGFLPDPVPGTLPGAPGFIGAGTSGDDIFRLEPSAGTADVIQDINGSDTVDFRFALGGIGNGTTSFDMDITNAAQVANGGTVEFRRIETPLTVDPNAGGAPVIPQPVTANSFVENFIGSTFNDYIFIDPLSLSGNFPVGSPPVARSVDGNNPPNANILGGTDPIPAGDTLDFDSKGRTVLDTGLSLTAVGVGTVAYRNIETLIPFENAPARVLNNSDVGFKLAGDTQHPTPGIGWDLVPNAAATGGSQYELQSASASHTATWLFNGVTPGLYRVSATWADQAFDADGVKLSSAAPFNILDGGQVVARELMDLQTLPDDFTDVGSTWEDIGGLVWISSNSLSVVLDPADGQTVVADSIRIERVSIETTQLSSTATIGATTLDVVDATVFPAPNFQLRVGAETVTVSAVNVLTNQLTLTAGLAATHSAGEFTQVVRPEIEVQVGKALILDGNGELDFGITRVGSAIEKTVRIVNSGIGDLTVTAGAVPAGFTSTLAAGPTTIAAGATLTFGITMDAGTVGDFAGDFLFTTNDLDEDEFSFRIAGSVAASTIIDDEDAAFATVSGDWSHIVGAGFEGDYTSNSVGDGGTSTWTFTGLTPGNYRVSATWPQTDFAGDTLSIFNSLSTQARYRVFDGAVGAATLADILLNQKSTPNDLSADGGLFEDIATSIAVTGTTLTVQLNNNSNTGSVIADAIRIERLPDQILTVTTDAGATNVVDDTTTVSFGAPLTAAPVTKTFTLTNNSAAGNDITLTGPITPPPGFSLTQSSVFGTDATPVVLMPGDSTSFVLQFDSGVSGAATGRVSITTDVPTSNPFDFIVTGSGSPQFVDNSDAGFSVPTGTIRTATVLVPDGFWNLFSNTGQSSGGDYLVKTRGAGTDLARWTFNVTPGIYQVSATWPGNALATTAAAFNLYETAGGTSLQSVSANQRTRPDGFLDSDTFWEDLGTPITVTTNTLVVELSDLFANGNYVNADSVRIERITDPEITVTNGGANLIDGTSTVNFGVTTAGTPIVQTFIVQNLGARNMFVDPASLAASVAAIPGFSLTTSFTSTEIAPGGSSVFQVQLDGTTGGRFSGTIAFNADDFDEQLFEINVFGDVLAAGAGATIIDDNDAGFTVPNGSFSPANVRPGVGFGGDASSPTTPAGGAFASLYVGSPTDEANYTFTGLTPGGLYRLSATWPVLGAFEASNTTFSVFAGSTAGTLLGTVQLNQRIAPNDFTTGGFGFEELMGPFTLPVGETTLVVQVNDIANGIVVVDAIRLDALSMSEIAVAQGATPLTSGTSTVDFGTVAPTNPVTRTITVSNNGNANLNLTGIRLPNGFTSTFTTTTIAGGGSANIDVVMVADAVGDFFGDVVLTSDDSNQSDFRFSVSGTVTNVTIVDNGDAGYVDSGFQTGTEVAAFGSDVDIPTTPGGALDTADWTVSGLTPGVYRVAATWATRGHSAVSNAPFTIHDGATAAAATLATVSIDQSKNPDDFADDGAFWEYLGDPITITGTELTVRLTDANGLVLADAIRVEPVTTPEIGVSLTVGGAAVADGGRINFGEIAQGADAAAGTINVTITNQGVAPLELGNVVLPAAGYTVTAFTSTTLAAGQTATFDIVLSTATAGTFAGVISIGNNDSDEDPFDIIVTGTVTDTLIIDDGDAGFTPIGTGWNSSSPGFDGDVQTTNVATDTATWVFSNLQNNGRYQVSAAWPAGIAGTTVANATYTLSGGATGSATFNQNLAPENALNAIFGTVVDRDETFAIIGDVFVQSGTMLTVTLSAVGAGNLVADAVRLELLDRPEVRVTQGTTNVVDGGTFDVGTAEVGTPTQTTFTITNDGSQDLILGTTLTLPIGYSLVNPSAPTLFDGVTSTTVTAGNSVSFDLQLDAAMANTFAGVMSFTSNDADETPFEVTVTGTASVAIAFDGGATALIVDNTSENFSSVNSANKPWGADRPVGFMAGQVTSGVAGGETATWTAGIAAGTSRVSTTWFAQAFAQTQAEYRIYDGTTAGTLLGTVFVDQHVDPSVSEVSVGTPTNFLPGTSFMASGATWLELGEFTFGSGTVTVQLVNSQGRIAIADAVRFSQTGTLDAEDIGPALPVEPDLMQENLPAIFDAALNIWEASGQATAEQMAQLRLVYPVITDLPSTQVGQLSGEVLSLDFNAAGHGWFVDPTPNDNSEFNTLASLTQRNAGGNSHAVGDIDLLTVVLHELGHVLGKSDLDPVSNPTDLMANTLPTGVRRLPESLNATTSSASGDVVVDLPATDGHVDVSLFDGYLVIQSNQTILERINVSAAQTLTINGTDGVDNFRIDLDQSGDLDLSAIFIHGYGDDDEIVLDGVPQLLTGSVAIDGGSGNDRIEVRSGQRTATTLSGSDGDDTVYGGMGDDSIDGGAGDDMLFGGSGNDRVNGGIGNDEIHGNTGDDTLVGNDGDDNIHGGSGHDVLTGGAGNDSLSGQSGNDTLIGHGGDDVLNGGAGRDALSGGDGQDQLRGGSQNDLLAGGTGNDELMGNSGHDTLAGEDGDDSLTGGQGQDAVDGGAGNNFIFGQDAVDSLFGASGLRNELLWNPQEVVPALASGSDTFIAVMDDSPDVPENDTENDPAPTPVADIDFNLFAEWIDLV